MHSAVLNGRDHTIIGGTACVAEGRAAIALSRGGAGKRYAHKDPNEDVAAFYETEAAILIVVADGNGGREASELAVARILGEHAPAWTGSHAHDLHQRWTAEARDAIVGAHQAIVAEATRGRSRGARTTLALALLRPDDDLLGYATYGDSHVFHVGGAEVVDFGDEEREGLQFLGTPSRSASDLASACCVGTSPLAETRAVVLVTDGISERGIGVDNPEAAVAEAAERAGRVSPDLRALETARTVVELALEAHRRNRAGDNVAAAAAWVS